MLPDVSVVIVTWNGRRFLEACLEAVAAQRGITTETILVDNGSTDGTVEFVRHRFPSVRIVELTENLGFAGGNNAGARVARSDYVAFLNNDAVPHDGWLRALRDSIDPPEGFQLATSRIVYVHDSSVIDSAGDGVFRWGGAFKRHHGAPVHTAPASGEVFAVCGAACLVARTVFEELGGFDESFFASHEDVDLSYRARLRGYRCWYAGEAVVRHHGSATLGRVTPFAVFHGQRNLEWMYVKNTPGWLLLRTLPGHLLYNVAGGAYFARHGLLGPFIKAKAAAVVGLPRVLRQRSTIQQHRKVTTRAIEAHLEKRWLAAKLREKRFDVSIAERTR